MLNDIKIAEDNVKYLVDCLSSEEPTSPKYRNRWKKLLKCDLDFLKEYAPTSSVLQLDLSNISFELEPV